MLPMQLTVRGFQSSPALEKHIRGKCEKLLNHCKRINSCRVVIEVNHKGKVQGKIFNVRIDLTLPGKKEVAVTKKFDYDVYLAIRDAFLAVERKLDDYSHRRNGLVKTHAPASYGRISRMMPEEGYGFIEGNDGNEYYFSMTNVSHPRFERLAIGDQVEYLAKTQPDGLVAHHIVIKDRQAQVA